MKSIKLEGKIRLTIKLKTPGNLWQPIPFPSFTHPLKASADPTDKLRLVRSARGCCGPRTETPLAWPALVQETPKFSIRACNSSVVRSLYF